MRATLAVLLIASVALAQNPIATAIRSATVQSVMLSIAQAYCKSKIAWEALTYSINNIETSLIAIKPQFDQLVSLLKPGGALYDSMIQWNQKYIGNYTTFKNYAARILVEAKGLATSLRAGASVLAVQYPGAPRVDLLNSYAGRIDDIVTKASVELQGYRALETMQYLSELVSITHPKEVDVYINSSVSAANVLAVVRSGTNITAMIPNPAETWLSLAACATDYANNTFRLCVAKGTPTNYTSPQLFYLYFNDPFYTAVYSQGLGSPCPVNYAQSHAFIVAIWNDYVTTYNFYITNVWPYENLLISTKNVLVSVLKSLATDLLQPVTASVGVAGKAELPGMLGSCVRIAGVQTADVQALSNYDPRDPNQLYAFLTNAANSFTKVFDSVLRAVNCMKYYLPVYERAQKAYLNALAQKFRSISGGVDIETWARENGIACAYTPPATITQTLGVVIDTYYALLDPNSQTSFLRTLNVTQPLNVLPPDQVPVGPVGSPCT
ncbi:MAG: hypothetical protein GXO07_00765 [Crenarchaeota archaeon]|nr:hypothetical protein [Thermoproteota archaeon]